MLEVRKEFLIFCVWVTRNLMGLKLKAADRDTIEVNKRNLASISVCLGLETNVTTFFGIIPCGQISVYVLWNIPP